MKNPTLLKNTLLILSCIILTALGFTVLNADSTTTIGLDINTGDITSTGTITGQDLTIEKSDDTTLTIYSNTDSPTDNDKLLIIQKGTTPTELFSVDEDGDVIIANDLSINNDLAITGNVTSGTWQGTAITNDYIGTGIDAIKLANGSVSNTEFQYLDGATSALQAQLDNKIVIPGSSTQGDVLFRNATDWTRLAAGTSGQFLKSQGAGADPEWDNVTRSATFVVAANDSSALSKQQADYVCDGTDDQVEIQAAIDALPDGGGKVVLMEGIYNITSAIDLAGTKKVSLEGVGSSTIINNQNTLSGHAISAINGATPGNVRYAVNIRNLLVKGNASSGDGIHLVYCDCHHIENIKVISHGRYGIYLGNNAGTGMEADPTISGCYILGNNDIGLYIVDNHDLLISHTHIEGNAKQGIKYTGRSFDLTLTGCNVEDNLEEQIIIDTTGGAVKITGNSIEGYPGKNNIVILNGNGISITGNQIDAGTRGIMARSGSSEIYGLVISGNSFQRQSTSAITMGTTGDDIQNVAIVGNTISRELATDNSKGIFINSADGASIIGNSIWSDGCGLWFTNGTHLSIIGNVLKCENVGTSVSESSGLGLEDCDSVVCMGNVIQKESTTLTRGIHLYQTVTNVQIAYNQISGATTSIVIDNPDSTIDILNNIGYTTENSGSATVSNGDTIAHGLASTPTYINLTTSNANHIASATSIDGTNITIGLKDNAGNLITDDETVYWEAEVR